MKPTKYVAGWCVCWLLVFQPRECRDTIFSTDEARRHIPSGRSFISSNFPAGSLSSGITAGKQQAARCEVLIAVSYLIRYETRNYVTKERRWWNELLGAKLLINYLFLFRMNTYTCAWLAYLCALWRQLIYLSKIRLFIFVTHLEWNL